MRWLVGAYKYSPSISRKMVFVEMDNRRKGRVFGLLFIIGSNI